MLGAQGTQIETCSLLSGNRCLMGEADAEAAIQRHDGTVLSSIAGMYYIPDGDPRGRGDQLRGDGDG